MKSGKLKRTSSGKIHLRNNRDTIKRWIENEILNKKDEKEEELFEWLIRALVLDGEILIRITDDYEETILFSMINIKLIQTLDGLDLMTRFGIDSITSANLIMMRNNQPIIDTSPSSNQLSVSNPHLMEVYERDNDLNCELVWKFDTGKCIDSSCCLVNLVIDKSALNNLTDNNQMKVVTNPDSKEDEKEEWFVWFGSHSHLVYCFHVESGDLFFEFECENRIEADINEVKFLINYQKEAEEGQDPDQRRRVVVGDYSGVIYLFGMRVKSKELEIGLILKIFPDQPFLNKDLNINSSSDQNWQESLISRNKGQKMIKSKIFCDIPGLIIATSYDGRISVFEILKDDLCELKDVFEIPNKEPIKSSPILLPFPNLLSENHHSLLLVTIFGRVLILDLDLEAKLKNVKNVKNVEIGLNQILILDSPSYSTPLIVPPPISSNPTNCMIVVLISVEGDVVCVSIEKLMRIESDSSKYEINLLWSTKLPSTTIFSSPVLCNDDYNNYYSDLRRRRISVACENGMLVFLDLDSGQIQSSLNLQSSLVSTPTFLPTTSTLLCPTLDGSVMIVKDENLLSKLLEVDGSIFCDVQFLKMKNTTLVLFGSRDSHLYCFKIESS